MAAIPLGPDPLGPQPNFARISEHHQQMSEHHQTLSTEFSNCPNMPAIAAGDQILAAIADNTQRLDALTVELNGTNQRLDALIVALNVSNQRLDGIDQKLNTMQNGIHAVYISLSRFI